MKSALGEEYRRHQAGAFADWRLAVEGRVATPRAFSLAELKQLPSRTQITRHTCEEGWTAIGQWTGVPLSLVLDAVGILPTARFVVLHSVDDWVDSLDLIDALHPQTILAYGMNGGDLPIAHGAPVRLRRGTADRLQEHEVPAPHRRHRRVRRRRHERQHPERLGLVQRDLIGPRGVDARAAGPPRQRGAGRRRASCSSVNSAMHAVSVRRIRGPMLTILNP